MQIWKFGQYIVQNTINAIFKLFEKHLNKTEKQNLINKSLNELSSIIKN